MLLYAFRDMIPLLRWGKDGDWSSDEFGAGDTEARTPAAALGAADELAAAGRFVEAMHVLLLQGLAEIRQRLDEQFADSLTSREILRSTRLSDAGRSSLRDIVARVELDLFRPAAGGAARLHGLPRELQRARAGAGCIGAAFVGAARRRAAGRRRRMSDAPVFSRKLLIGWIAGAVVVFAISMYLMGGGEPGGPDDTGPSTFSRSAIGHAGLAEVLQRLGVSVVKSRYNSLEKLSPGSLLVIAEPHPSRLSEESMRTLLKASTILLVLPKWGACRASRMPGGCARPGSARSPRPAGRSGWWRRAPRWCARAAS